MMENDGKMCKFSVCDSGMQGKKVEKRWFLEHTVRNNTVTIYG